MVNIQQQNVKRYIKLIEITRLNANVFGLSDKIFFVNTLIVWIYFFILGNLILHLLLYSLCLIAGPLYFEQVVYNGTLPSLILNPNTWTKVNLSAYITIDSPIPDFLFLAGELNAFFNSTFICRVYTGAL